MFAAPAWSNPSDDLHGGWVLSAVETAGTTSRDPRWNWVLTFKGDEFGMNSTSLTEKHLLSKDGQATTQAIEHRVEWKGRYSVKAGQLNLSPGQPMSQEQKAFAGQQFGEPDSHGAYHCPLELAENLKLRPLGRTLVFVKTGAAK